LLKEAEASGHSIVSLSATIEDLFSLNGRANRDFPMSSSE
jgi:hypothetical protein